MMMAGFRSAAALLAIIVLLVWTTVPSVASNTGAHSSPARRRLSKTPPIAASDTSGRQPGSPAAALLDHLDRRLAFNFRAPQYKVTNDSQDTFEPTRDPSPRPTRGPTRGPTRRTRRPTPRPTPRPTRSPVAQPTTGMPSRAPTTRPTFPFRNVEAAFPLTPFTLGLEYPRDLTVNNIFRNIITDDLDRVLTGYLDQEIGATLANRESDGGDGSFVFLGVDLSVAAADGPPAPDRRLFHRAAPRALQQSDDGGEAPGESVAYFDFAGQAQVLARTRASSSNEDDELRRSVEEEVDEAVRDALANEEKMMAYIRANSSSNLLKAIEGVEEPIFTAQNNGRAKNFNIGVYIGTIIGGIVFAGLLAVCVVIVRRREKDRDPDDDYETTSFVIAPKGSKDHQTHLGDASSASSASYGYDGGRNPEDDDDTFARELEEAASVDRNAWPEQDGVRNWMDGMARDVGTIPPPASDAPKYYGGGGGLQPISEGGGMLDGSPGRRSPLERMRGTFGSGGGRNSPTPSGSSGGSGSKIQSESSGGWPSGNAATVAGILAAADRAHQRPGDQEPSALEEFESVKQFVDGYEQSRHNGTSPGKQGRGRERIGITPFSEQARQDKPRTPINGDYERRSRSRSPFFPRSTPETAVDSRPKLPTELNFSTPSSQGRRPNDDSQTPTGARGIIEMFDSEGGDAIKPESEHWQYESQRK